MLFPFTFAFLSGILINFLLTSLLLRRKREENKKHIEQSVKERQKVCLVSFSVDNIYGRFTIFLNENWCLRNFKVVGFLSVGLTRKSIIFF